MDPPGAAWKKWNDSAPASTGWPASRGDQGAGHAAVPHHPGRHRQAVVGHAPQQRVDEAELPDPGRGQDVQADRLVHRAQHHPRLQPGDAGQERDRGGLAYHGRRRHDVAGGRAQLRQSLPEDGADRRRHDRVGFVTQVAESSLLGQHPHQLPGQQRVPTRHGPQPAADGRIDRAAANRGGQLGELPRRQAVEVDHLGAPRQAAQRRGHRRGRGARRADDQDGHRRQDWGQVREHEHRRGVGPLQVVQHQHAGPPTRHRGQVVGQARQPSGSDDLSSAGGRHRLRQPDAQPGQDPRPGPQRPQASRLPAARPADLEARRAGPIDQLLAQARLAGARLPGDQDQPAPARSGPLHGGDEAIQLGITTDEVRRPGGRHRASVAPGSPAGLSAGPVPSA